MRAPQANGDKPLKIVVMTAQAAFEVAEPQHCLSDAELMKLSPEGSAAICAPDAKFPLLMSPNLQPVGLEASRSMQLS
jgi:hypothetical protein